jgi:hypothetical protein
LCHARPLPQCLEHGPASLHFRHGRKGRFHRAGLSNSPSEKNSPPARGNIGMGKFCCLHCCSPSLSAMTHQPDGHNAASFGRSRASRASAR